MEYSSILKRFFANFIDNLIILVPFYCLMFVMIFAFFVTSEEGEASSFSIFIFVIIFFIAIVFSLTSFLIMAWFTANSKYMGTPGKVMLGMKVVTEEGEKLTFGQAAIREGVKSFFSPYVIITAFFSDKKQAVHDILVKSVVVEKE